MTGDASSFTALRFETCFLACAAWDRSSDACAPALALPERADNVRRARLGGPAAGAAAAAPDVESAFFRETTRAAGTGRGLGSLAGL